jgi:nitrite reductase/ring-hydroxylating ferredoxin subunit
VTTATLKRNIFQRLFGISATKAPDDSGCWTYSEGRIVVDLNRAPELAGPGGAISFEGRDLPKRVLLIHSDDDEYIAFCNHCSHMGRRLDPVPGTNEIQCCSVSKTTYNNSGDVISGPVEMPLTQYTVHRESEKIVITI